MALRDIILQMNSYPEPTPAWAVDNAAALAGKLGAKLSVGVCQVHIPPVSNWLANQLINAAGIIAAEKQKSAENAKALLSHFSTTVDEGMRGEALLVECTGMMITYWQLARRARAYDLLVVPVYGHERTVSLEGLTFETGRPLLLLTEGAQNGQFDHVVVGWDGSATAARALADSLCICAAAKTVKIVVITGEKDLTPTTPASDIIVILNATASLPKRSKYRPPSVMLGRHSKPIARRRGATCWSWVPTGIRGFGSLSWGAQPSRCSIILRFPFFSHTDPGSPYRSRHGPAAHRHI